MGRVALHTYPLVNLPITHTPMGQGYKGRGSLLELHRTTPLSKTPRLSDLNTQFSSNMSFQTRSFGDKTFNAIGYGGMGLSIAYGAVGTDEERLKVTTVIPSIVLALAAG